MFLIIFMDAVEAIKKRTSIRNYKPSPVPEEDLNEILECAIAAPSAGNTQEWEFVVVKDKKIKKLLVGAALGQEFIAQAPVIIVVCVDLKKIRNVYGRRGVELYSKQDAAAAIENMLIAAWAKGIGSCWIGAFNESAVSDMLVLPSYIRPVAIITLGYPEANFKKPERKDLKEVVHFEHW